MSEAYPLLSPSGVVGFVASTSEFTVKGAAGEGRRVFLWSGGAGYEIEWKTYMLPKGFRLSVREWAVYAPLEAYRVVEDLDRYVDFLAKLVANRVEGRRLVLSFSGGKDSTAALVVLDKLYERVRFKLHIVHVHMPYLEPSYHVDEAERIASKLGYNVEVIEPPRRILARRLLEEGLPWRRARWCTYYKTRPLLEYFEKVDGDFMVVGDRVGESLARSRRLRREDFFDRDRFEPIKPLSLIDVAIIVRRYDLVHRDYLKGLLRVSCRYCPYKGIAELLLEGSEGDEDPGLIEEVLKREWRRWYSSYVDYEMFVTEHLWRYVPRVAAMFASAKKKLAKGEPSLKPHDVAEMHSSIWLAGLDALEKAPLARTHILRS